MSKDKRDPKAVDDELMHVFYRNLDEKSYAAPSRASLVLGFHVAHKGLQAGGCAALASSAILAVMGPRGFKFFKRLTQISAITTTGGILSGLGLATKKIKSLPESEQQDGIEDRAFRIFHNRKQNQVDRYSLFGIGTGMIGGTVVMGLSYTGLIGGAGLGAAVGVLTCVATRTPDEG
eukprot:CAMPEP_0184480812 /NCGR_PEP_ID=MMETSP0113_2-20130426/2323_1 /TAXON_ID=91329 /ORGANISM="Norrisiella sphaerica, Strain BC52" /LENGTH=176 /DNA_ID=CAMNT_0026859537 /DNA_START=199 /DNA_END=729 /DNA_ORIENTATION=-